MERGQDRIRKMHFKHLKFNALRSKSYRERQMSCDITHMKDLIKNDMNELIKQTHRFKNNFVTKGER